MNNKTSVESRPHSALPIPLNSSDISYIRSSTSRSTTLERRTSISLLDLNILPTSTDIINFDNPNTENFQIDIKRSPLVNFVSLQDNQPDDFHLLLSKQKHSNIMIYVYLLFLLFVAMHPILI
jgi:hypothetical protein